MWSPFIFLSRQTDVRILLLEYFALIDIDVYGVLFAVAALLRSRKLIIFALEASKESEAGNSIIVHLSHWKRRLRAGKKLLCWITKR